MSNITAGTIARTIILILALLNQILVSMGKSPLNIADDDIATVVSIIFTIVAAFMAWWKNNSFTKNAIKADTYKDELNNESEE